MIFMYDEQRQEVYAYLFGLFLFLFLIAVSCIAFFSLGPIVLGTEMNANGSIEYLCLGRGCEDMRDMDW